MEPELGDAQHSKPGAPKRLPMGFWLGLAVAGFWVLVFIAPRLLAPSKGIPTTAERTEASRSKAEEVVVGTKRTGGQTHTSRGWWSIFDAKVTDYGIFALTIVLTWVAVRQHHTTRVLERAYLSVEPAGIRARKNRLFYAYIDIKNSGRLPARDVSWTMAIKRFGSDDHLEELPIDEAKKEGRHVIPPGGSMRHASAAFSFDIRVLRQEAERYFYVWGKVSYDDGFGRLRVTEFCHRYNSHAMVEDRDGAHVIGPEEGRHHITGNHAT